MAYRQFDCADAFLTLNELINSDNQKCKRGAKFDDDLLAIDVNNEKAVIELYCHRSKQWTRMDDTAIDCTGFRTELVNSKLYIIGGMRPSIALNSVNMRKKK